MIRAHNSSARCTPGAWAEGKRPRAARRSNKVVRDRMEAAFNGRRAAPAAADATVKPVEADPSRPTERRRRRARRARRSRGRQRDAGGLHRPPQAQRLYLRDTGVRSGKASLGATPRSVVGSLLLEARRAFTGRTPPGTFSHRPRCSSTTSGKSHSPTTSRPSRRADDPQHAVERVAVLGSSTGSARATRATSCCGMRSRRLRPRRPASSPFIAAAESKWGLHGLVICCLMLEGQGRKLQRVPVAVPVALAPRTTSRCVP